MARNLRAGADDGGGRLGEDHGRFGDVLAGLRALVETGLAELLGVVVIVLPDAKYVAAWRVDRREEGCGCEGLARALRP